MSGKKNKRLLGVISIFLWAVILTIVLRSYLEKTGYTLPVFWIVILACAAAFLGWWVYMSVRINHLIKRLDAAGFQYQTTHDEKAYLAGRTAEASTLLETARTEITNDRARQLLKAEEEQLL